MSKSILQSIKPQYCELIASGKKSIEVRKTKPKLDVPFKVYIYCTKDKTPFLLPTYLKGSLTDSDIWQNGNGKVIGEYVCDRIDTYESVSSELGSDFVEYKMNFEQLSNTCLGINELCRYGKGKTLYGWHISDLKIYDKPKELNEFYFSGTKCRYNNDGKCTYKYHCFRAGEKERCGSPITRPPQSWGYVEEE